MGREFGRSLEGVTIIVVESSSARSKDDSSNKSTVKNIEIKLKTKCEVWIFEVMKKGKIGRFLLT